MMKRWICRKFGLVDPYRIRVVFESPRGLLLYSSSLAYMMEIQRLSGGAKYPIPVRPKQWINIRLESLEDGQL